MTFVGCDYVGLALGVCLNLLWRIPVPFFTLAINICLPAHKHMSCFGLKYKFVYCFVTSGLVGESCLCW